MPSEPKIWKLIQVLSDKTAEGKIHWEPAPYGSGVVTVVANHGFSIRESGSDFVVEMRNPDGVVIEELSDVTLKNTYGIDTAFGTLLLLFNAARRDALGVDNAIDSVLRNLEDL